MVDRTLLPQRTHLSTALGLEAPSDDDALFVSEDEIESEIQRAQKRRTPDKLPSEVNPASTFGFDNPFGGLLQPALGSRPTDKDQNVFASSSQPTLSNPSQPPDTANKFSSLFTSGNSSGAVPQYSAPTTGPTPLASSSLFPSSQAPETNLSNVFSGAAPTQRSPFTFSLDPAPLSSEESKEDKITDPGPGSLFQFKPTNPPPVTEQAQDSRGAAVDSSDVKSDSVSLFNNVKKPIFSGAFGTPSSSTFGFSGLKSLAPEKDLSKADNRTDESSAHVSSPFEDPGRAARENSEAPDSNYTSSLSILTLQMMQILHSPLPNPSTQYPRSRNQNQRLKSAPWTRTSLLPAHRNPENGKQTNQLRRKQVLRRMYHCRLWKQFPRVIFQSLLLVKA